MTNLKDIAGIKDMEERRRAISAWKEQREAERRNDPMGELKKELQLRLTPCPMFLKFAIAPLPNFLQGKVPIDGLYQRTLDALRIMDFGKPDVKEILVESYSQEVELVRAVIRAFGEKNLDDEDQLEALRQEIQEALEAYLAQPEMERKHYLL